MKEIEKIFILICGQLRATKLVYHHIEHLFSQYYKTYYVLSTDLYSDIKSEYEHHDNINDILSSCPKIHNICLQQTLHSKDYRNAKNYTQKIVNGCKLLDTNYDLYMIIRSDLILESTDFIKEIQDTHKLYVSNFQDGNLILTRNIDHIRHLSNMNPLYVNDLFDIELFKYLKCTVAHLNIPYHLLLSQCHVIAISGDSGSGKSTLCDVLSVMLSKDVLKFETDRYHKWERGHDSYQYFTHLNPEANYLQKLENDVYNLRIGNHIYAVDYNHTTGMFTPEKQIDPSGNIILCGLHTLWSSSLRSMLNTKIYMDTDDTLRKLWKTTRDITTRNKTQEQILQDMTTRQSDYKTYIESQRNDADIIIRFAPHLSTICCTCIFRHKFDKILRLLVCSTYKYFINDTFELYVTLTGDSTWLSQHISYPIDLSNIRHDFYGEIQLLIYLYSVRV